MKRPARFSLAFQELVVVAEIGSILLGRELAATEQHSGWSRVLEGQESDAAGLTLPAMERRAVAERR
ncbi:MAG: hypothetical protein IPG04_11345 [Polyangiaceae bacterium]|nr:hypothetical protein [Polyangiaceae bacterium]